MTIIDSHIHLYPEPILNKEFHISDEPTSELLYKLSQKIRKNDIEQAVVYILDSDYYLTQNVKIPDNLIISVLVNINGKYIDDLKRAFENNVKMIKILPYEQNITRDKYFKVMNLAKIAKEKNMVLTICSTYGSRLLYDTNGVELAAYIKKEVDIPIILAHGGGYRIIDAMSLVMDYHNVFLDLSFSIKYWQNSSILKDYAFAIKKLGSKKCFYGSDYPYVKLDESMKYFSDFMNEYNFTKREKDDILFNNFNEFKNKYLGD